MCEGKYTITFFQPTTLATLSPTLTCPFQGKVKDSIVTRRTEGPDGDSFSARQEMGTSTDSWGEEALSPPEPSPPKSILLVHTAVPQVGVRGKKEEF